VQDARLRRSLGRDLRNALWREDPKFRRFRYGVQVNSLGLTEQQPENNVYRILIEMLAVTLSKKARARAVQLAGLERGAGPAAPLGPAMVDADAADHGLRDRPAGIRRPLRRQPGVDAKVEELKEGARGTGQRIDAMGGAIAAIDYMKGRLVEANADR
jgi:(2R)-ethylmalonyl-CoA mutase